MVTDTSMRVYYEDVLPNLAVTQAVVLDFIVKHPEVRNWTNRELKESLEEYTGDEWLISTVTPRVKELRDMGLLVIDEKRPCDVSGKTANAVKLCLEGYKEKMDREAQELNRRSGVESMWEEWFT